MGWITVAVHPPSTVLGRLADPEKLRAFSAVALGATSVREVATETGVEPEEAARAIASLARVGLVRQGADGLEVAADTLSVAARSAAGTRIRADLGDATPEEEAVVRNFVDAYGRIQLLPAREKKRRIVLEWAARRVKPDRTYTEPEINAILVELHDDHVTLRRLLVDEGLLERDAGAYRRAITAAT